MGKDAAPVIAPGKGDRRFNGPDWDEEVVFDHLKQAYLIYADYAQTLASHAVGMDPHQHKILEFYTRRNTDAMFPTNFAHSMFEGPLEAIDVIRNVTGAEDVNVAG